MVKSINNKLIEREYLLKDKIYTDSIIAYYTNYAYDKNKQVYNLSNELVNCKNENIELSKRLSSTRKANVVFGGSTLAIIIAAITLLIVK